ncbi:MAG: alpha/beta hydrolase [Dehalococcoidia bacterium]|nr:alpha/beta hydrolase [Dehalococcoidia bacterium]
MAELTLNGARITFDDAGTGTPAIVFIHGWACDRRAWAPQFEDITRDHRAISVDLRGRGESEAVPPFDTTQAADDVAALIRELGLGPSVIVGHSLGGLVALLLNDRHPELVLGTVMGDSPLTGASGGGFAESVRRIREAGSMEPMRGYLEGTFFTESTPPEVRSFVLDMMLSCPADIGSGMLSNAELFTTRMGELLKKADEKPFMAIWAAKPLGNPERLRNTLMFVRQEPIAGAGHFFQLEQPAVTNALLRAFLDEVERDPRVRHLREAGGA